MNYVPLAANLLFFLSVYRPPSSNPKEFFEIFEPLVVKLGGCKRPVIISGDFNFDLLNLDVAFHKEFLNIMLCSGLFPSISLPTRVTKTTATLLDNIFFSGVSFKAIISSVSICDMSDHFPVSVVLDVAQSYLNLHFKNMEVKILTDRKN